MTEFAGLSSAASSKLLVGEKLARSPRLVVKEVTRGRFADNLGAYIGVHFVSPVIADVLRGSAEANVQLVPVSVRGKPALRYFAVNVLDSVALLDRAASKVTTFVGTDVIDTVTRLSLVKAPPRLPPIFHLAEIPVVILVSDALRRALQAASPHPGVLTPSNA